MFEHADAIGTDRQTGTSVASAICVIAVVREHRVALETDPRGARDRFGSRRARGGGIDPQLNRERIGDARKRIRGDLDVVIDPVEVHRRQGRWKRHDEGLNRPVVRPVVIGPHQPKVVGHASGKAADRRAELTALITSRIRPEDSLWHYEHREPQGIKTVLMYQ